MKVIATAALAASLAFPAFAHSETTMNEENELFSTCSSDAESETCEIKRELMVCEPSLKYENWEAYVAAKDLPAPAGYGRMVHPKLGPMMLILVKMDEHYAHIYSFIVLEQVVCLSAIVHYLEGDPA